MEVHHKAKLWHGWREFLREYAIVVVGVLTALAAEQGAEWLHWRHQAHLAREAIAFDLRRFVGQAALKDVEAPCEGRRLGELAEVLDQAQANRKLPPLGLPVGPYPSQWGFRSWSALNSGGTLAHLSNREQLLLSSIWNYLGHMQAVRDAHAQEWAVVRTMAGPGRPTSDAEITFLRSALAQVYWNALSERSASEALETIIAESGFLSREQIDAAFKEGTIAGSTTAFCRPAPPPAASTKEVFGGSLLKPPVQPGEVRAPAIGVGGALTTER